MKTEICRQYWRSLRSFSEARSACWQIAWRSDSYSVIFTPKLRLHTICCFVGGASSSERQLSPFSSRTVRSRTTEKFLRMKVGFVRARSSAVFMPSTFSLRAIRLPTPQISSTGCSESSFRVLCGFPLVRASTPRNCFHSFEAHWADFARVFVGPAPTPMVRRVQSYTC